jgi:hypothetical protein
MLCQNTYIPCKFWRSKLNLIQQEFVTVTNIPHLREVLLRAQNNKGYFKRLTYGSGLLVQNFDQLLDLHMPVTINSLKKYNEITPVYVSTEIHLYTYLVIPISKPTGYGLLQGIFRV